MPKEKNVLEEEVNEFDNVFSDIVDKTDEELAEDAVKEASKKTDVDSGESKEDQSTEENTEENPVEDPTSDESGQQTNENADTGQSKETSFYEDRIKELEEELSKERQRTNSWDGRIKAANKKVKSLEAENQKLKDQLIEQAKSTPSEEEQSEEEIMSTFKETFPELVEVIDIMQRKIDAKTANLPQAKDQTDDTDDDDDTDIDAEYQAERKKIQQQHLDNIRRVHPELDEIVSSGVLRTWVNKQPDYIRPHLNHIYDNGSAEQLIKMISEFKNKSGFKSNLQKSADSKQSKLDAMRETGGESPGPIKGGPDKQDFQGAAKEAGL